MELKKTISGWAEALFLAQEGKSEKDKEKVLERLVQILRKSKKEHLLEKVLERLEKIYQREKRAELILARNLKPEFLEKTKKKLLDVLGRDKEIKTKVEESLIGGFRIKTGNFLIRASLKDFLSDLKNY